MFIKSLEINNLYGKRYFIPFKKDLVILYGLNGSGKTTVLNILYSILDGDIKSTLIYKYESLRLTMIKESKEEEIEISFNEGRMVYEVRINGRSIAEYEMNNESRYLVNNYYNEMNRNFKHEYTGEDINTSIYKELDIELDVEFDRDSLWSPSYSSKNPRFEKTSPITKKGYRKLSQVFRSELVYVPLDRKVKGIEGKLFKYNRASVSTNKKNIENSLKIAENYYKEYLRYISQKEIIIHENMRVQILTELSKPKEGLMYSSFRNKENDFKSLIEELNDPLFSELRKNVIELNSIYQKKNLGNMLNKDTLNSEETSAFFDYTYATAQLENLHNVIDKVRPLKSAIDDLKEKSNRVIKSINELFKETDKEITYDVKEGEFHFRPIKRNDKVSLNYLSSGEKQLIMFYIFSIIKFDKNDTKILFIDEPELSLHIDWQSKLLPSIVEKGDNTQIIVATHSPDIIGDFVSNTVQIKGELI